MAEIILGAIWAQAANGVIGREGDMPWHAPEDLAHFKQVTGESPVIMGRTTWESIPEPFRPLPGRPNLVVSSAGSESGIEQDGAFWFSNLEVAISAARTLAQARGETHVWIMGGASIYAQALGLTGLEHALGGRVSIIERTVFEQAVPGDAYAPSFDESTWQLTRTTGFVPSDRGFVLDEDGSQGPLTYRFETWIR